jgi:bacteriocin-like protein
MERLTNAKFKTLEKSEMQKIMGGVGTTYHCASLGTTPDGREMTEHNIRKDNGEYLRGWSTLGNTVNSVPIGVGGVGERGAQA